MRYSDGWDATINAVVSRLRNMLRRVSVPEGVVSIHGEVGRYQLRLPRDVVVDWERARSAIHTADTAMRRRDYDAALSEARVGTEIAGRPFLVGEQGPWIEGQRRAMATSISMPANAPSRRSWPRQPRHRGDRGARARPRRLAARIGLPLAHARAHGDR